MNQVINNILAELTKSDFPDLPFLFSQKALKYAPDVLAILLDKEQKHFEKLLQQPNETLTFDSFNDESILFYYWALLNHLKSVDVDENIRKIIEDFRPTIEDFHHSIAYNKTYFDKMQYADQNLVLDEEQKRIMYLGIKTYKDRGIDLDTQKQNRLKEINKKISQLGDDFNNNIVYDQQGWEMLIKDFDIIKNLPAEVLSSAQKKGQEKGGYLFDADPTSYMWIMKYCSDSTTRKHFEDARNSFASSGKYDNRSIVWELLKLRKEKANILGYKNYTELSLNNKMADSPEQVLTLIHSINNKAKKKAYQEVEELKNYFHLDEIHTYDVAYYATKMKEEKYHLDDKEFNKYFEYESVFEYLCSFVAGFFGVNVKKLDIKSFHDDVHVYEIYKNDTQIAYYLLDPFYRKTKRPGAWADSIRSKTDIPPSVSQNQKGAGVGKKLPIVVNVCNFQKNNSSKTTLSIRDVELFFHEFGHALHEMLSKSKYSELSGFGVEWDFIELPSQLLENWVTEKESLVKLGSHVDTGDKIPNEMVAQLEEVKTFMSGIYTLRQTEFTLLDIYLYSREVPESIEDLDRTVLGILNQYGIWQRNETYKQYASFTHIFSGGYAAGYYSYMWAEILEADVFEKIKELGMFDPKVGDKLITCILGQGTIRPAKELFFDFMGREVSHEAFMKRKGF